MRTRLCYALFGVGFIVPITSTSPWDQFLLFDSPEGIPCLRVLDNHGSPESHLLVFDTGLSQSSFPNASRPEPEITILMVNHSRDETPLVGPYGSPVTFTLDSDQLGDTPALAAGKLTSFSNTFGTFMLLPSLSGSLGLIFDPIATEYCVDGNPIYVSTSHHDRMIRARMDVLDIHQPLDSRESITDFFEISSGTKVDFIPESIFELIIQSFESSGGILESNETYRFSNCTSLSTLPFLSYSFANHDGPFDVRTEIHMLPEDYTERLNDDICALRLRPSVESRVLGLNLLRNIAVHFDDINDQIGFCDPISE